MIKTLTHWFWMGYFINWF